MSFLCAANNEARFGGRGHVHEEKRHKSHPQKHKIKIDEVDLTQDSDDEVSSASKHEIVGPEYNSAIENMCENETQLKNAAMTYVIHYLRADAARRGIDSTQLSLCSPNLLAYLGLSDEYGWRIHSPAKAAKEVLGKGSAPKVVVMAIHVPGHWIAAVVLPYERLVYTMNSLMSYSKASVVATQVVQTLCEELTLLLPGPKFKGAEASVPQQTDPTSCGVYTLQYVECVVKALCRADLKAKLLEGPPAANILFKEVTAQTMKSSRQRFAKFIFEIGKEHKNQKQAKREETVTQLAAGLVELNNLVSSSDDD